ncbi:MAG: hypothetical protein J0I99_15905 [Devosia sp.]|uniref:hypothetical protein n=1 Tax=Devosia sp. TaxID=1871048 RepID=UPI001AC996BA|nr:hypothetical protein [Devosia sp.]MBN9310325.1 hypothetical protein [Devosia sp.]MBN9317227.1 hypothetical protein [Devosia sp.]
MSAQRLALVSITTLVATLVTTGIHHIFRLGPGLIVPTLIGVGLAIVLWVLYSRTRKAGFLVGYGAFTALVVFWFGILDGFLDHVVKAAGLDNITFLAGGDAEVVAPALHLWSQEASTAFYEGTGILSAILALLTAVATVAFIYVELHSRPATSPEEGRQRSA